MTVILSDADFATMGTTFANNYKGTPTTVFTKKKISMDWTKPAALTPAEFDVIFKFDTPFLYSGADALLWETVTTTGGSNVTGYAQDWYSGSSPATVVGPIPSSLGRGCNTGSAAMNHNSSIRSTSATDFQYGFDLSNGPASAPALMFVGSQQLNLPLFCGSLQVVPLLDVPLGSTDASGNIALNYATTTWSPNFANGSVMTQVAALDRSQPGGVALSNGLHTRSMRVPGGAAAYNIKRSFNTTNAASPTGSTPSLSSVAVKYGY